jgi:hypothetical protein
MFGLKMAISQLSASKDVLVTSIYCKSLAVFALYCWLYLDLLESSCIHAFPFVWVWWSVADEAACC